MWKKAKNHMQALNSSNLNFMTIKAHFIYSKANVNATWISNISYSVSILCARVERGESSSLLRLCYLRPLAKDREKLYE